MKKRIEEQKESKTSFKIEQILLWFKEMINCLAYLEENDIVLKKTIFTPQYTLTQDFIRDIS